MILAEVAYFMIMAPTREQKQRMDMLEPVQIQKPEWKGPNVVYIMRGKPIVMINGRKHFLIHWKNLHYKDGYIDISYIQTMEEVSKLKCKQHPPGELPPSPKQCDLAASRRKEALKPGRVYTNYELLLVYTNMGEKWRSTLCDWFSL